jgi:hypothetical protein
MIIEIVDTDYYAMSNPHIEIDDPGKLKLLYQNWKEVPNPGNYAWSFAQYLVEEGHAK